MPTISPYTSDHRRRPRQQRVDDPSEAADATVLMANAIRSAAEDATSTATRFVQLMCSQSCTPCRGDTATRPARLTGSVLALAESSPHVGGNCLNPSSTLPHNESFEENLTAHFLSAAKHGAHETWARSTVDLDWPKVDPEVLEQEPPETWGHDLQMSVQRRPSWVSCAGRSPDV